MVFLTSNLEWSPASVADLYRCRWSIEAFFKQIKQTLQLADFLGPSASGLAHGPASACPVRRRRGGALAGLDGMAGLCAAALSLAFRHGWSHRFTRLFTLVRSALWRRWDRASLLHCAPPQSDPMGQPRATSASSPPHSSPALTAFDLSCGTAILLLPTEDRLKILNLTFPPATLPPCDSGARYLVSTPYGMAVNCVKSVRSVSRTDCVAFATPKSMTFGTGTPSCIVIMMFDGLRSRWMMPF